MKVYIPQPCTCPPEFGNGLNVGWQEIETAYAKQLLQTGQALDQKAYDALQKQLEAAEKSNMEYAAKARKAREAEIRARTSAPQRQPATKEPTSSSKYERTNKVG